MKIRSEVKKEESVAAPLVSASEEVAENCENNNETSVEDSVTDKKDYGTVLSEISGTPIVVNLSGVTKVPDADNFSIDISDFKPYDMLSNSTGNYQNIVKLTREFKHK